MMLILNITKMYKIQAKLVGFFNTLTRTRHIGHNMAIQFTKVD